MISATFSYMLFLQPFPSFPTTASLKCIILPLELPPVHKPSYAFAVPGQCDYDCVLRDLSTDETTKRTLSPLLRQRTSEGSKSMASDSREQTRDGGEALVFEPEKIDENA